MPYADLVRQRVCEPAGWPTTGFLRTDELPGDIAVGYLFGPRRLGLRTNVLHLPVLGSGDGGIYTTVADVHRFWDALVAGRIVPDEWVGADGRAPQRRRRGRCRYGLGFWLDADGPGVLLEGYDAGVSFRIAPRSRSPATTWTVVSNSSDGAWPVAEQAVSGA